MLSTDRRRPELVNSFYNPSRTREKRIPCKTQFEITILPSYCIPGVEGGALVKVGRFGIPGISGKSEQSVNQTNRGKTCWRTWNAVSATRIDPPERRDCVKFTGVSTRFPESGLRQHAIASSLPRREFDLRNAVLGRNGFVE